MQDRGLINRTTAQFCAVDVFQQVIGTLQAGDFFKTEGTAGAERKIAFNAGDGPTLSIMQRVGLWPVCAPRIWGAHLLGSIRATRGHAHLHGMPEEARSIY